MKNKYKYLVSYNFKNGYGNFELTTSKKINTFDCLRLYKEHLEATQNLNNVVINNYILVNAKEFSRKFIK